MADEVTATNDGGSFEPHAAGQFAARCVDVLNMGEKVEQFGDHPQKLVKKCALVFVTGEKRDDGNPDTVSVEFTVSMGERANLRRFLEDWRGKSYTDEEADAGVPIHKLEGQPALITVEHKKSSKKRLYAKIKAVQPLPKQMQASAPTSEGYKRAEWWGERKKEYAAGAKLFKENAATMPDEVTEPDDNSDDLPF